MFSVSIQSLCYGSSYALEGKIHVFCLCDVLFLKVDYHSVSKESLNKVYFYWCFDALEDKENSFFLQDAFWLYKVDAFQI